MLLLQYLNLKESSTPLCDDDGQIALQDITNLMQMPNLKQLSLHDGSLTSTCNISMLTSLTTVQYDSNQLHTIQPSHFWGLSHLKVISLKHNPITTLPNPGLPNLRKVDLQGVDTLICDCSVRYLKHLSPDSVDAPCQQPVSMKGISIRDIRTEEFICSTSRFLFNGIPINWLCFPHPNCVDFHSN